MRNPMRLHIHHANLKHHDDFELTYSDYRQDVVVSTCVLQVWQHWPLRWSVILGES